MSNGRTFFERMYLSIWPSFWPLWLAVIVAFPMIVFLESKNYLLGYACVVVIILSVYLFVRVNDKIEYSYTKSILVENSNGDLELTNKSPKGKNDYVKLLLCEERGFELKIPLTTDKNGLNAIIHCEVWLLPEIDWLDFLELEEIFGVWQKDKKNKYLSLIEKFAVQPIKEAIEKSGMSSLLVKGFINGKITKDDLKEGLRREIEKIKYYPSKFLFDAGIEKGIIIS